uniref:Uncharacterized protein n=1 Tax=viral metagenome TaxID=1070528 RepID=A0A6C0CFR0_9ZZZZ
MSRPLSYEQIVEVLSDAGVPYNPATVQQNCRSRQEMCGCNKNPYHVDSRGILKFDCGCNAGKPKLPSKW